jgi:uncharacterized protein (DUF302 family)
MVGLRRYYLGALLAALASVAATPAGATEPNGQVIDDQFVVYQTRGDFDFILGGVRMAVVNQGLQVRDIMHLDRMLERTGRDLGLEPMPYRQAESVEFCSAYLAHLMAEAHPANPTTCPLTVYVYTRRDTPNTVYVAYEKPRYAGDAAKAEAETERLLRRIAESGLSGGF